MPHLDGLNFEIDEMLEIRETHENVRGQMLNMMLLIGYYACELDVATVVRDDECAGEEWAADPADASVEPDRIQHVEVGLVPRVGTWQPQAFAAGRELKDVREKFVGEVEEGSWAFRKYLGNGTTAVAEDIGRQLVTTGRRNTPKEIEAAVDAVTTSDVMRCAKKYLWDKDIAVAAVGRVEGLLDYSRMRAGMTSLLW
ncbi:Mitochondrial-processing peptidase subunit beta [Rhodotorula toruloides]